MVTDEQARIVAENSALVSAMNSVIFNSKRGDQEKVNQRYKFVRERRLCGLGPSSTIGHIWQAYRQAKDFLDYVNNGGLND